MLTLDVLIAAFVAEPSEVGVRSCLLWLRVVSVEREEPGPRKVQLYMHRRPLC